MKNITYILLILIILVISCKPVSWTIIGNGDNMKNEINCSLSKIQLDSACNANGISSDFKNWITLPLIDNETKVKYSKHLFIQKMDSLETIYTVIKKDGKYKFSKRITY